MNDRASLDKEMDQENKALQQTQAEITNRNSKPDDGGLVGRKTKTLAVKKSAVTKSKMTKSKTTKSKTTKSKTHSTEKDKDAKGGTQNPNGGTRAVREPTTLGVLLKIQSEFKHFDANHDGELGEKELLQATQAEGVEKGMMTTRDAATVWRIMDHDESGGISKKELGQAIKDWKLHRDSNEQEDGNKLLERVPITEEDVQKGNRHAKPAWDKQFKRFDENHDGELNKKELLQALTKLGVKTNKRKISSSWSQLDEDRSGGLSEDEVNRALQYLRAHHEEDKRHRSDDDGRDVEVLAQEWQETTKDDWDKDFSHSAFHHFDADRDGQLDKKEFLTFTAALGLESNVNRQDLKDAYQHMDNDKSGTLSEKEVAHGLNYLRQHKKKEFRKALKYLKEHSKK